MSAWQGREHVASQSVPDMGVHVVILTAACLFACRVRDNRAAQGGAHASDGAGSRRLQE